MPGIHWCDYTTPADVAKDAAACLWWWSEGDRQPMLDFVRRIARYHGSAASTGESWFGYPGEGGMGDRAAEVLAELEDGDTAGAFDFLSGFAAAVPEGFDLNAFLRQSARDLDYWDMLPDEVVDGHEEAEEEAV